MDLGIKDFMITSDKLKNLQSKIMQAIPHTLPHKMPMSIGKAFSLNKVNFLYIGKANATVAGYKKNDISWPPLLKASYLYEILLGKKLILPWQLAKD